MKIYRHKSLFWTVLVVLVVANGVELFLDGSLNPGFRQLRRQFVDLCSEMDNELSHGLRLYGSDPGEMSREDFAKLQQEMDRAGLGGVPVFETKEDGQKTRSIVYPYAKIHLGKGYVWLNLLENIPGLSGEESLNRSAEALEYKLTDALVRLTRTGVDRVAFLEGHGELEEVDVAGATEALAQHFEVDRGQIGDKVSVLNPYKVIIVAKPTKPFSEKDKYVLDQYLMRGGRLLWLVDAVSMTVDTLRNAPNTIGLLADNNLGDMLFRYGVRINPSVVEDMSCGMLPISVPTSDGKTQIVPMPWRFGPLMSTNMGHPVTRNVSFVHGDFASPLDTVGEGLRLVRTPLLRSSQHTKVSSAPVMASLMTIHEQPRQEEFSGGFKTFALLEEGVFPSAFVHRHVPSGLSDAGKTKEESVRTKMIVVGDGDVVRNDVRFRYSEHPTIVPLGYDELSRQTYGNKDFIVNSVLYLADDDGMMSLRNRTFAMRLLDKQKIGEGTALYKLLALVLPLLSILVLGVSIMLLRRRRYGSGSK